MQDTQYVLYDFSNESPLKIVLFLFAIGAMILCGILINSLAPNSFQIKRSPIFIKIWVLLLCFIAITVSFASGYDYLRLRSTYVNKTYKIAEGSVNKLQFIPNEKGNQTFEVGGTTFENHVTKGLLEYYFGERNVLHDSMPLRIFYTEDGNRKRVLRVEVEPSLINNDSIRIR